MTVIPVDEGENVEHGGDVRVIVSARLLEVLECLLAERHSDLVAPLGRVLDDEVVEGAEAGGDLVTPTGGLGH